MTTRPKTLRLPLPAEPASTGAFQNVAERCVYNGSSNRFVPERSLERKARLRLRTLDKAREFLSPPATRQRVA